MENINYYRHFTLPNVAHSVFQYTTIACFTWGCTSLLYRLFLSIVFKTHRCNSPMWDLFSAHYSLKACTIISFFFPLSSIME